MKVLIISANLLFREAISETLSIRTGADLIPSLPGNALERIQDVQPEVILVDEAVPAEMLEKILSGARRLEKARLILLNCLDNDLTILDTLQVTLGSVEDLLQSIEMKEGERRDGLKAASHSSGNRGDSES